MVEIAHSALVADIEAATAAAQMSKAEFGRLAVNDPCLVYDLLKGRELRRSTMAKVRGALEAISLEATQ